MGVKQLGVSFSIFLVGQVDGDAISLEQLRQSAAVRKDVFILPKGDVLLAQRDGPLRLSFAGGGMGIFTDAEEEEVCHSN